ncbi:hypothetical protein P154DRAFT_605478 [Amniculicola lignicola CBS 123094]|uniref:Uncharacterized protein n=1 Tax=Amniculicola lignicola CBS 123094 TaxID=1392246 RepID=A0A6A5W9K1_9PLEO|nr:hypothetical protein P154DRAFT_605478 [Amniculicola lignicola CBS 123094]
MEGADSFIAYLPEEESSAQDTKKMVEKRGGKCNLHQTDVRDKKNYQKLINDAVHQIGKIDIPVHNAAFQMTVKDTKGLDEYIKAACIYAPSSLTDSILLPYPPINATACKEVSILRQQFEDFLIRESLQSTQCPSLSLSLSLEVLMLFCCPEVMILAHRQTHTGRTSPLT